MNISSEIFINESHFSAYFFNGTDFHVSLAVYIICILLSCPPSSYVIWLILRGTGNGLAAEFFILNLSVCEILLCVQMLLDIANDAFQTPQIAVFFLDGVFITGPHVFQCLICVERYLAVIHPVTFMKYKPLRYRLMCSAVAWMLSFVYGGISFVALLFVYKLYFILYVAQFLLFLSILLFCCQAVLRALKQSGPGEREEENHTKRKAFQFIFITTVTTVILYVTYFISLFFSIGKNVLANMCVAQFCFILAGLVQPVLFLYRVGKLNLMKCQ